MKFGGFVLRIVAGMLAFLLLVAGVNSIFQPSRAELMVQNAQVTIRCFNNANNPSCGKPLHPSAERVMQLEGMTSDEADYLCRHGYKEHWFDNQGHSSPNCHGFDDTDAGWMASPYDKAPKKPGVWEVTWLMTSPQGQTVLTDSKKETVYRKGTVYVPENAVSPTKIPIPRKVGLICLGQEVVESVNCGGQLVGGVGGITLGFVGITPVTIAALCGEGYTTTWTDNHGRNMSSEARIYRPDHPEDGCMTASEANSDYSPRFEPPLVAGPWVITWKLISPAGEVELEAHHSATVVVW